MRGTYSLIEVATPWHWHSALFHVSRCHPGQANNSLSLCIIGKGRQLRICLCEGTKQADTLKGSGVHQEPLTKLRDDMFAAS